MRWWPLLIAAPLWGCGTKVIATDPAPMGGAMVDYPACAPDQPMMGDTCLGATPQGRCRGGAWTAGVSCATVHAATASSVGGVLADAKPGSCVDLAEGDYGDLTVPDGVSLLGRGWDCVSMGQVTMNGGGVAVRGVTARSVEASAGGHLELRQLVLEKGANGLSLTGETSATLKHVTVRQSSKYAIASFDGSDLEVEASLLEDLGGPGLWFQCGELFGPCDSPGRVTVKQTRIDAAAIVGVSVVNAETTLDGVDIVDTQVGPNFESGAGVSLVSSEVDVKGLRILDAADVGLLCADCSGTIGDDGEQGAVVLRDNLRGFWAFGSGEAPSINLRNVTAEDNFGVGIAADGPVLVTVAESSVSSTQMISMPVLINGVSAASADVGDGILWTGGAMMKLSEVRVGSSARVPILINGAVGTGSSLERIELVDGDDVLGIIHQNADGSSEPEIGEDVPDVTVVQDEAYEVAAQSCFGDCG